MTRTPEDILKEVIRWRKEGYPETSEVTKRLLHYWFIEDHFFEREGEFKFWDCQREAFETLVYLYSIKKQYTIFQIRDEDFKTDWGEWTKYAFQMATGSGKTFVMAMVIVWQYFLKLKENDKNATTHFLLVAPNTIVLDRLLYGFEGGGLFQEFPFFIPEDWRSEFDIQIISQSSGESKHGRAVLHITNRHQFHKKKRTTESNNPISNLMQYIGGPQPTKGEEFKDRIDINELLLRYDKIIVFNDEAHHAHPGTEWFKAVERLHNKDKIIFQLDFTATATNNGRLFPHLVYNYPLKRAVKDKIVKRPIIITLREDLATTGDYIEDFKPLIKLADEIFKKKKEEMQKMDKKPVLFVLCNNTNNADKVGKIFSRDYGYGNNVLVLHTYTRKGQYGGAGDIRKDQLEEAKRVAREIDHNNIEIIVSVLMLSEGWDVKNVMVTLPMRAFASEILTEQTLGRGLRRMFPSDPDTDEYLYVVEHPSFTKVWEEKMEAEELPIFDITHEYSAPEWIMTNEEKFHYDITIPIVKGGLIDQAPELEILDIDDLPQEQKFIGTVQAPKGGVIKIDIFNESKEKIRDITLNNFFKIPQEYLSFLTKQILKNSAASQSQFHILYPKLRDYIKNNYFREVIDISDELTFKKLHNKEVIEAIFEIFIEYINVNLGLSYDQHPSVSELHIKNFQPFQTTHKTYGSQKSVFDILPYDSEPEKDFMIYLDKQDEVLAYTRIFWRLPVYIAYYDKEKKTIRKYRPDFIVKAEENGKIKYFLVEIKGEYYDQQATVKWKAKAGESWCETVSALTGNKWEYVKIMEEDLKKYKNRDLFKMVELIKR